MRRDGFAEDVSGEVGATFEGGHEIRDTRDRFSLQQQRKQQLRFSPLKDIDSSRGDWDPGEFVSRVTVAHL